jgi:hypothetical protein
MLEFLRHALAVTAAVEGHLALPAPLQWIAGKRVADVMTAAPFAAVLVLTRPIRWFDMGEHTQHRPKLSRLGRVRLHASYREVRPPCFVRDQANHC